MVWIYCSATALAGQVVTPKERDWAKRAMSTTERQRETAPVSPPNSIAVLYFNNKTGLADLNSLQKGMALMLTSDLSKVKRIQVMDRVKVQALLDAMNHDNERLDETKTALKIGKMLNVYYIVRGGITLGKMAKLNINPSLTDVPFETTNELSPTVGNMQDIFQMEKDVLFNIIKKMKIYLTPVERAELGRPFCLSSAAAISFFNGVDLADRGRYAEAAGMYKKAASEEKSFTAAKDALRELKTLGLVKDEEIPLVSPTAREAVEEGSSKGNVSLATLGAVAVGGALAIAVAAGAGGGSSSTTVTPTPTTGPVVVGTDPAAGTALSSCSEGIITFSFDKTIQNCLDVRFTQGWSLSGQMMRDNVLRAGYKADTVTTGGTASTVCDNPDVTILKATVNGCEDLAGHPMSETSFQFLKGI